LLPDLLGQIFYAWNKDFVRIIFKTNNLVWKTRRSTVAGHPFISITGATPPRGRGATRQAVAGDRSAQQLPANAQPIFRGLQRKMDVLAGVQLNDCQPR